MPHFLQAESNVFSMENDKQKEIIDNILQLILKNTEETKKAVSSLQESISRIEVITEQNKNSIANLDKIVWQPVGENVTLVQAYAQQSEQIRNLASSLRRVDEDLTITIQKVESDLRVDIASLSAQIGSRSTLLNTLLIGLVTTLAGTTLGWLVAARSR